MREKNLEFTEGKKAIPQNNEKSKKIIENKMYEWRYLDENFEENIKRKNLKSSMRKKFRSYGQKSNSYYYHPYQYWIINDFNYDSIIDSIFTQLDIAKELI